MPRFYFDTRIDGDATEDDEGIDLPDIHAACLEATAGLADLAKDAVPGCKEVNLEVRVSDLQDRTVLVATVSLQILMGPDAG